MSDLLELWERPAGVKTCVIGLKQWADAGDVSSGLPRYLVELTDARQIGRINANDCYLFQLPGTHHLLRPRVKLAEGRIESIEERHNDIYFAEESGLAIFIGDEPHLKVEAYAEALLDAIEELGVQRAVTVAGVYGAVPYEMDRDISCIYSLPRMRQELERYAVGFSDYEGGATICTFLAHKAAMREMEMLVFFALVPSYDLGSAAMGLHPVAVSQDYKAWYDLAQRISYMFRLGLDLSDLERRADELIKAFDDKIQEIAEARPDLKIEEYLTQVRQQFTERSFIPLDDVWLDGLRDLLDDDEE